jgi:hypothetical protein
VDLANDRLYTVGINSILVFDTASQANGNVAPTREIVGPQPCSISHFPIARYRKRPALRNQRRSVQNVLVFDSASTTGGNAALPA